MAPMPGLPSVARIQRPARWATMVAIALLGSSIAASPVAAQPTIGDDAGVLATAIAPTTRPPASTAIEPGAVDRSSHLLDATYVATLRIGWQKRSVRVSEAITVTNTSGGPIDRIELNAVPARLGRMVLGPVSVDGASVAARLDDQTIVVPLGGILPSGASARLDLSYRATLRTTTSGSDWMFSQRNGIIDLYRWLPWVSRRLAFARPNHGDPFVTPSSRSVRVTIVTDRRLRIAMNGRRVSLSADAMTQVWDLTDVRDVIVSMSPDYRILTTTIGGVSVRVFTRPGGLSPSALVAAARPALTKMASLAGAYPYQGITIAESAGGWAMEGPGVIWIPRGTSRSNIRYLVTHEIAHQWFYGIVGNDQAAQPFTDEALADFMARYVLASRRGSRCAKAMLDHSIYHYSSACYYETIYIQGGNLLDYVRRRMGSGVFWSAIRAYVADHRFGLSTTQELLTALDDATPLDLGALFARRFPRYYPG
jgi:hypothetical protein